MVARAAIVESFKTWDTANALLSYDKKGEVSKVPTPRLDGKNVIGWKALSTGTLAVTYVWYYTASGNIAEFDMVFNNNYRWDYTVPVCNSDGDSSCNPVTFEDPTNTNAPANAVDLRNIGTHEAGHTLMLLDLYASTQARLTMYGLGAYAELKKDTLALGDDLGVDAIY